MSDLGAIRSSCVIAAKEVGVQNNAHPDEQQDVKEYLVTIMGLHVELFELYVGLKVVL